MVKKMTIEQLAEMIQSTMASKEDLKLLATKEDLYVLEQKVDTLEQKVDTGFFAVNRRIDLLREDISDLPDIREEFKDYDERLTRVERKVGHAT